jgi:thymidylate synthase (FAD)
MNNVKLISHSTPSAEFTEMGVEDCQDLIAFCARVSNPSNQLNKETADKLIKYLIKHKHWSPLEMVSACLEINTTRDIARQILRHRSFSFQEFSQRYADPTKDMDFVLREARLQDQKNRQNSIKNEDSNLLIEWFAEQQKVIDAAKNAYDWAIKKGIAKEQYIPTAAVQRAWRKGKVILAGPECKYVKKDEIVIFPNNLGVGIGNADISGHGKLKKGIFLNESRLFGIAKKKDENKSDES